MDEYIKQNASGLYLEIQKIGCFFRAALWIAEKQTGRKLKVEQINKLWNLAQQMKYIPAEGPKKNCVQNSEGIATLALRELGDRGRIIEVGTFCDGKMIWYGCASKDHHIDYYIQKIKQGGPSVTHFRNVDKEGHLLWDPHEPEINVLDIYYTICYKYEGAK